MVARIKGDFEETLLLLDVKYTYSDRRIFCPQLEARREIANRSLVNLLCSSATARKSRYQLRSALLLIGPQQ